ncbi:MAG TPA: Pvc16 family protein [Ilumatobacteraceae bacterium]
MLTLLDEGLEAMLRATVPLSAVDIDVSFESPDDEWSAQLTRPTVNIYLWDVRRSVTKAVAGTETFQRNGVPMRRMQLPRVELHYAVTVWTSEHDDERTLLGALLTTLLGHEVLTYNFLPASLADLPEPSMQLIRADEGDVFSVEGRMKLTLQLKLTTAVDTGAGAELATAVSGLGVSLANRTNGAVTATSRRIAGEVRDPALHGARVRSPLAIATISDAGRFLIKARPGDELVVEVDPPLTVVVPPIGGVVVGA